MITVTQQPGDIAFSRNPMIYGLQSDNLYQSAGQKFIGLLSFPDFKNNGYGNYTFVLYYGGNNLQFEVDLIGDDEDSGYQLPPVNGAVYNTWLTASLARFQSNYYLSRDFVMDIFNSAGTNVIRFTAKKTGDQYMITSDVLNQQTLFGEQLAVISLLQAGVSKTPRPNFKIMIEVWMMLPDGSDYERLSQAFPDVDDDGSCVYDISGTISDGLCAYGYDRPSLAMPASALCPNSVRQYYLQVAEVFGDAQVIRAVTQTTVKTAFYGGFSKKMVEDLVFPDYFVAGDTLKFLDQELTTKTTRLSQPEFLTFCNFFPGDTSVAMRVVVSYSDNTTDQLNDMFTYADVPQYGKIVFPTGYSQLNLGLYNANKTVVSWTVTIYGEHSALSETRTYVIDYTYRPYGKYLLYQNSFGGYISNFTYGKASREYEFTLKSSEITPKGGFKLIDGEILNYDQVATDKITLTTGFMQRRQLLIYRDFMLSVDKFLVDKGKGLPIGILSDSIKEFKDGDNLYAQTFDIGFQWAEEVYTYDPDEVEPFSPADVSNYIPPVIDPDMPDNFDDRYYLKTLTYNRVEIDAKIAAEATSRANGDADLQSQIDEIEGELANKVDVGANYNAFYYTKDQVNAFLLGADPVDYAAGANNPITIADFLTAYPNFGDYPAIMVLEPVVEGPNTNYKDRTDIQPKRNFVGGHLDNIVFDCPTDGAGKTISPLRIIFKAT